MKSLKINLALMLILFCFNVNSQTPENNVNKKFSFGINFSPDYSYRRLHSNNADDNFVMYDLNKKESPKLGFTTGATVLYSLNERIALESGLQFSDKTYKYEMDIDDYDFIEGISVKDDPAIPLFLQTNYHYYYLGVPIKLNFYVLQKNISLFISTGVSTDFYIYGKIKSVLEYKDRTEKDSKPIDDTYFNKVSFIGLFGFGLETDISNRFQFRLEPIFRYSFTPLYDSSRKENLYSIGANFTVFFK